MARASFSESEQSPSGPRGRLKDTVDRLRYSGAFCSENDWRDLLELTDRQYWNFSDGIADLPDASIEALSEFFALTPQQILSGQIDFRELALRCSSGSEELPEKYMVAAFGRRRTPIVSLDYLEEFHGWHARAKVLKKFEVAEAALTNPMAPVNAKFFSDVCAYLHQECGLTDSDFLKMGAYSLHGSQRSMLTKILSRQKDPKTLYEVFFTELTKFFERNCIYKVLELTETRCVVDIILHREIGNALKIRNLGNPQSCTVKRGIVSSVTGYLDLPFANVDETRCVHRGDPACRFDISFEEAAHQLKLRDASGGRSRSQERN